MPQTKSKFWKQINSNRDGANGHLGFFIYIFLRLCYDKKISNFWGVMTLERTKYPTEVQEWMTSIEQSEESDAASLMAYCTKLYDYAQTVNSEYLKGFSLFFRGFGYYRMAKLEESMGALSSALHHLIAAEDWYMTARTYNFIGNVAEFQADLSLSTDCYCKGLAISKEHGFTLLSFTISSNIANVHISLGQLEFAAESLHFCEQLRAEGLEIPFVSQMIVYANLATCYTRLGHLEKAEYYLDLLVKSCGDTVADMTRVVLYILRAELYHVRGDIQARDAAIAGLNSIELQATTIFDALNELCRHARMLLELDKIDEFLALVSQIETRAEGIAVEKQVLNLRLQYYKKIGDWENQKRTALRYYEVVTLCDDIRNTIISHNITARISLNEEAAKRKEIEKTNLLLKQRSEHDALTGMNNRYKLNEFSELAFRRAYTNGTTLTVELLDIDFYKQFNDNYGHQAGDDCLVRIAGAIRSMEEYPHVFTARYGGDEFVIIYEDYTLEGIETMARTLQEKIHALQIPHQYSRIADHITITQGLFHRVPTGANKPWDFLHCADMALYVAKKRARDSYYIATSLGDVTQESL